MSAATPAAGAPDGPAPSAWQVWSRCFRFLDGMRGGFLVAAWASVLVAVFNLGNAHVMKLLFDGVLVEQANGALLHVSLLIVVIYFCKGVASFIARHTTFLMGSYFAYKVRKAMYEKLVRLPMTYFEAEKTGQILSRFTVDVQMVQNNTNVFYHAVKDLASICGGVVYALKLNPALALRTFFVLPLVGVFATKIAKTLRRLGQQSARQAGDVTSFLQETVVGVHEVQGFSAEDRMAARFDGINTENKRLLDKSAKWQALSTPSVEIIVSFGLGWVIYAGSADVVRGAMTPGQFIAFLVALGLLFEPMRKLSDLNNVFSITRAHAERFLALLDFPLDLADPAAPRRPETIAGAVEFEDVAFLYPGVDAQTLRGVSLTAAPGEVVALVGSSGAGKSTLVKLLTRFYDVSGGEIRVDGVPVKDFALRELRDLFGIVPQETVLFSGTVAENIAFGVGEATEDEIVAAAEAANARGFIEELDAGFETQVGERGVRLSGGQKQRIAIARALLKDPRILVLDEATSSLDSESERLVQEALDRLMKSRTTFVIAHRLSTIQQADQILVMNQGRVVERGTHPELLAAGGEYARLSAQQRDPLPARGAA